MSARHFSAVGALFFALLSGGFASVAQAEEQQAQDESPFKLNLSTTSVIVAEEVFGSRTTLEDSFGVTTGASPNTRGLSVTLTFLEGTALTQDDRGLISYRLVRESAGAQAPSFGEQLTTADWDVPSYLDSEVLAGGSAGDDFVWLAVTANTESTDIVDDAIILDIPELQGLENVEDGYQLRVLVGFVEDQELIPLTEGDGHTVTGSPTYDGTLVPGLLLEVRDAVSLELDGNSRPSVRLSADLPSRFNPDFDNVHNILVGDGDGETRQGLRFARISLNLPAQDGASVITEADGATAFTLADDTLNIRLDGTDLSNYDFAFVDLNKNRIAEESERIPLPEDFVLSGTDDIIEQLDSAGFYLVADGETELVPGSYFLALRLDYNDENYRDEAWVTPTQDLLPADFAGEMSTRTYLFDSYDKNAARLLWREPIGAPLPADWLVGAHPNVTPRTFGIRAVNGFDRISNQAHVPGDLLLWLDESGDGSEQERRFFVETRRQIRITFHDPAPDRTPPVLFGILEDHQEPYSWTPLNPEEVLAYFEALPDGNENPDIAVSISRIETAADADVSFRLETTSWNLAAELFGTSPPDPTLSGGQTVSLTVRQNSGIDRGASALIEYRLTDGMQFAGTRLTASNMRFRRGEGNTNSDAILSLHSGGEPGDDNVVFRLATSNPGSYRALAMAWGDELVLTIPAVQNLGALDTGDTRDVQVSVMPITAAAGGGFSFKVLDPLENGEDGNSIANSALVRVGRRFAPTAAAPGVIPTINLSNRTRFTDAEPVTLPNNDRTVYRGVSLGTLRMEEAGIDYKAADGTTSFSIASADRLLLMLNVSGAGFHENARAFVDLDSDLELDEKEVVSLDSGLSIRGADVRRLLRERGTLYLLTDGEALLEPAGYQFELTLDYANPGYQDASVLSPMVEITYAHVRERAFAYAVPNCTQVERGDIHIINETQQPLTLFVQGVDQAGTELGMVELDLSILRGGGRAQLQPGEALDLMTEHVEQLFNLNAGNFGRGSRCRPTDTWQGRAQLTFFANGNLTLVPQLRGSLNELRDLGGFNGLELGDETIK